MCGIADSIIHWKENLQLAYVGLLNGSHIYGDNCALCRENLFCDTCPLESAGHRCSTSNSPWRGVQAAVSAHRFRNTPATKQVVILQVTCMLNRLEALR